MARIHHTAKTTDRGLGWEWQKRRLQALKRDLYLCQPCKREGRVTPATEVHHIKARADGGGHELENLLSICPSCHEEATRGQFGQKTRAKFDESGRVIW